MCKCQLLSRVQLFVILWGIALQAPLYPWDSPGKNTRVGCYSLLQGIFLTQVSNPGLLHCRRILYQLSHRGNSVQFICVFSPPLLIIFCVCQVQTVSVLSCAHLCMKCFLGISLSFFLFWLIFIFYRSRVDFCCVCFRFTRT